jgi:RNA polymerase sigma-70 factor (ECF subfamily)
VAAVERLPIASRMPRASVPHEASRQHALYDEFGTVLAGAVERLARGYEADEARRQDLVQEIHVALWRSFASFDGRCSLRSWVYRVAHNVAVSHVLRDRTRGVKNLVGLEEIEKIESPVDPVGVHELVEQRRALDRLLEFVRRLAPTDRQVILLYLEGEDAAGIGEVTGLSASNVATKIHRIKKVLTDRFQGGAHG